jgi:uncharacterized membrane protein YeaQ/YmgE (transglycosylase-associated protein family)
MYEPRGSIRRRALRVARQRGWIGKGAGGTVVPIVIVAVAVIALVWMAFAITGFVFSLLPMALLGLLTGLVASRLLGTRLGLAWTILAGIAGSWLGGALFGGLLRLPVEGFFNPLQWAASIAGAAIVIAFTRAIARPALTGSSRQRLRG